MAQRHGVFIGGDDFKSGQTKMKSVLVDFLVSAGIKVRICVDISVCIYDLWLKIANLHCFL